MMGNKIFKQITSLVISTALLLSFVSVFVSADDHWASEYANKLIYLGIVSGYSDGSLKFDNTITRAEFAKIINKSNGFARKAEANFNDVSSDKWYFDEMLIAKGEGYMLGDNLGNANPEASITRAEAAVIIARVLNLSSKGNQEFTDSSFIPEWAKDAVMALYENNILKGYPDGSFKPFNTLTRGEAFSVIAKSVVGKENNSNDTIESSMSTSDIGNVNVTPSGGGGGGSGGGGYGGSGNITSNIAETPVIVSISNNTLVWKAATGAKSYKIKITLDGNDDYIFVSDTSINLLDKFKQMAVLRSNASEDFIVSVMSVADDGHTDSGYSTPVKLNVEFLCIESPLVSARYGKENGIGRAIIEWNSVSNASGYLVSIKNINMETGEITVVENSNYQFNEAERRIIIPDTSVLEDNSYVCVTAKSNNSDFKDSKPQELKLSVESDNMVVRDGLTEKTAWIITSDEEFAKIGENDSGYALNHYYEIQNDITVRKPIGTSATPFKGHIVGRKNGTNYKPTITLDITGTGAAGSDSQRNLGMIGYMTGGSVSNLILKGNVVRTLNITETKSGIGAVVGYLTEAGEVSDCINYATISQTLQSGSLSGSSFMAGIVGQLNGGTVTDCMNYGEISGANYVGGIVGRLTGAESKIQNSSNHTAVTGKDYTGGVVGTFETSNAENHFLRNSNYAKVKGSARTGGLCGHSHNTVLNIIECFNAGEVEGNKDSAAFVGTMAKGVVIKDSFVLKGSNNSTGIVNYKDNGEYTLDSKNVYSLLPLTLVSHNSDIESPGTVSVSSEGYYYSGSEISDYDNGFFVDNLTLKNLINEDPEFLNSVWTKLSDFDYPQLKNNPYTKTVASEPQITDFKAEITDAPDGTKDLKYSWVLPPNVKTLKVKVTNNTEIKNLTGTKETDYMVVLEKDSTEYIISDFSPNCYYEITVIMEFEGAETVVNSFEQKILVAKVPENINVNNNVLAWNSAEGAKAYKIKVQLMENGECVASLEKETTDENINLVDIFGKLAKDRNEIQENYNIQIMSVGDIGYYNSAYSDTIQTTYTFQRVSQPINPYESYDEENYTVTVLWSNPQDVTEYIVELKKNGESVNTNVYKVDIASSRVTITDPSFIDDNTKLYITALSNNSEVYKNAEPLIINLTKRPGAMLKKWLVDNQFDAKTSEKITRYEVNINN